MQGKEIKILHDSETGKVSFYRMESGDWRLIDESEDCLRPYMGVPVNDDSWDEGFFAALREAAYADENDRLVIWFEGGSDEYGELHDRLNDCDLEKDIRIKRMKPAFSEPTEAELQPVPEETVEKTKEGVPAQKEAMEQEEPQEVERGDGSDSVENALNQTEVPQPKQAQTQEEGSKEIREEEINEESGALQYPADGVWSWRHNYPEIPAGERKILRITENTIVDTDQVLVNKHIVLAANVSIVAKVECIHCTVAITKDASVDVLKNASVWLKHCDVHSCERNYCWYGREDRHFLAQINGEFHIYDSIIEKLTMGLFGQKYNAWAIKSEGRCDIVDTSLHNCTGLFIKLQTKSRFFGSRISTEAFKGCFIDANWDAEKMYLEKSSFQFLPLRVQGDSDVPCFFRILSRPTAVICECDFILMEKVYGLSSHHSIKLDSTSLEQCTFQFCAEVDLIHAFATKCRFIRCRHIDVYNYATFRECVFENCVGDCSTRGDFLTHIHGYEPSNVTTVENCKFHRCISNRILQYSMESELKKCCNFLVKNCIFQECITTEALVCVEFRNIGKDIAYSRVQGNKFFSCSCRNTVESKATYGLFSKPCNPVVTSGNETIPALSSWTESVRNYVADNPSNYSLEQKLRDLAKETEKKN